MRKTIISFSLLCAISALLSFSIAKQGISPLEIGAMAPLINENLTNSSGMETSLKEEMGAKGLLVIFSSNTCPFVVGNKGATMEGWEGRYASAYKWAKKAKVNMVLINSNEATRSKGESLNDMKTQVEQQAYQWPYLLDQNHQLADAFGARTTPHVFLFGADFKLLYRGAIDDSYKSSKLVKQTYLKDALKAIKKGKEIALKVTDAKGCTIKRLK